jgi:hypothetical protein
MPLTDQQKDDLDHTWPRSRRLHLLSHAEIEEAFSKTLESLVGGHYRICIKSWSDSAEFHTRETINMSAQIEAYTPEKQPDLVIR